MKQKRINSISFSKNRIIIVFCFFLYLMMSLAACTSSPDLEVQSEENASVPIIRTPTMRSTPTMRPTPTTGQIPTLEFTGRYPFNLSDVSCQFDLNLVQDTDYWSDALTPGISTVDDLLNLQNISEENRPERRGEWIGSIATVDMTIYDNVLISRTDQRTELGEIVAHYGIPEMIVWKIPSYSNEHPINSTYLVYPEHNAMFWARDKVMYFTIDTEFKYSNFIIEDLFLAVLSSFETDRFDRYVESVWPCSE